MCERKFVKYKVVVEFLNGDKETINMEDTKEKSYKEMLNVYRDVRDEYLKKDICVRIFFLGVTEDKKMKVQFVKEIKNNNDIKKKEKFEKIVKNSVLDVVLNIKENLELILEKDNISKNYIDIFNKKRDIIMHNIENLDSVPDDEKIKVYDEIKAISNERRFNKNSRIYIDQIMENCGFNIKNTIKNMEKIIEEIHKQENKEYVKLDEESLEELKIMRTYKYKSYKQVNNLLKQLKPRYDKVVNDVKKMRIVCYNKANNHGKNNF